MNMINSTNIPVEVLRSIGVSDKTIAALKNDISYIHHINEDLPSVQSMYDKKADTMLSYANMSLSDLHDIILKKHTSPVNRIYVVTARHDGSTLADIASDYNVSRQRIQQLEKNTINILTPFFEYVFTQFPDKTIITTSVILEKYPFFNEKLAIAGIEILKENPSFTYIPFMDGIISSKYAKSYEELKTALISVKLNLSMGADINDSVVELLHEKNLDFLTMSDFHKFLNYENLSLNDFYVENHNEITPFVINRITNRYYDGVFTITNDSIREFDTRLRADYPEYKFASNKLKSLRSLISKTLILCDKSTYCTLDKFDNLDEIKVILTRIVDDFSNSNLQFCYFNRLFTNYESDLQKLGVSNYHTLHGLLQYYYKNNFYIKKDILSKTDADAHLELEIEKLIGDKTLVTINYLYDNLKQYITRDSFLIILNNLNILVSARNGRDYFVKRQMYATAEEVTQLSEIMNTFKSNKAVYSLAQRQMPSFLEERKITDKHMFGVYARAMISKIIK